jgi:hypothetical protein
MQCSPDLQTTTALFAHQTAVGLDHGRSYRGVWGVPKPPSSGHVTIHYHYMTYRSQGICTP